MKFINLTKLNKPAKIAWSISGAVGLLVLIWAFSQSLNLTLTAYGIWFALFILAGIFGYFPAKVPHTKTYFSIGSLFIFVGIIFVGVSPTVFIAGLYTFLIAFRLKKDALYQISEAANAITVSFASGQIFYLALSFFFPIDSYPLIAQNIPFELLALAVTIAASFYFIVNSLTNGLLRVLNERVSIWKTWVDEYVWLVPNYFYAVVFVCPIQILAVKFGFLGSAIFMPIVILTHILACFFLNRISEKHLESKRNERLHLATVESLAAAIDARDQMSHGHIRRVQFYAKKMAKILGLSEENTRAVETAALLHGVGKLAVPDQILNKPQPLNQAELEKIKTHTEAGAAILAQVNFPYPVTQTILYSREHWDGTGYPEGLRDEEIPLTSRILAIADTYDTLRENRPYRLAKSREEARKTLLAGAGTEFDPKLVDIFLRNLHLFEEELESKGLYKEESEKNSVSFQLDEIHYSEGAAKSQTYLEQIKQANRESFSLFELAREFSSSLDLENVLQLFGKKIQEFVPSETCIIYLYDETSESANPAFLNGRNTAFLEMKKVEPGEGITGLALKKRESIESVNPMDDFGAEFYDIATEYTAMAAVPLVHENRLIGALSVYSTKLLNYSDEDMRLLETVSRIATDALSRAIAHAESENRALTDPMTGLPNARSLQMQFEKEAARASRTKRSFQVLMLDLDEFKKVNDTFGHKAGDLLLKEVSKVMRQQLREYDFLARYAGDEFAAILPDLAPERAQELCQRMEQAVLNFRLPMGNGDFARVGISIGIAAFPTHGETLDQVLIAADKMMYDVKAKHKEKRPGNSAPVIMVEPEIIPQIISTPTWAMPSAISKFDEIDEIIELGDDEILDLDDFDTDDVFSGTIKSNALN